MCAPRTEVEPDQRLLVPPAGGGRDPRAGDRLLDGHGDRCPRRRARLGTGVARAVLPGLRLDLVLRQRRHPLRRGDLQAPRHDRHVGSDREGALPGHRRQGPAVPLRRAGQLAGAHRGPAGEQRPADRARDARRDAVEASPGAFGAAPGVERGARPAPPVGSAVVAAHAAGAGVRDRPARVRRHLRRLARDRAAHERAARSRAGRARRRAGDGRGVRVGGRP